MTNATATANRLRERLDRAAEPYPQAWTPEPGDELLGTFEGFRSGATDQNENHPIALVRDANGELYAVWLLYGSLRAEFDRENPHVGETLMLRREKDRTNTDGPKHRAYSVAIDRNKKSDPFADTSPPIEDRDPPTGDWTFSGGGPR